MQRGAASELGVGKRGNARKLGKQWVAGTHRMRKG
jgi:hypothetical protein